MLTRLTRLLCFIISFQLAVGCGMVNNSQLSVLGGISGEVFNIRGSIVKTFRALDNFILSSAVAADVHTGTIEVVDYTDPTNPVLIESLKLYNDAKTFDIEVPKEIVKNKLVSIEFVGANSDVRQKIEDLSDYEDEVEVILDARASFYTAILKAEVAALIEEDPTKNDEKVIQEIVQKFEPKEYEKILKAIRPEDFARDVKGVESFNQLGALLYEHKDEKDPKVYMDEMKYIVENGKVTVDKKGLKFICEANEKPKLTADSSSYEARLSFSSDDPDTKSLFRDSIAYETSNSMDKIKVFLDDFYVKAKRIAEERRFTIKGILVLFDKKNDITTTCVIEQGPAPVVKPKAATTYYDQVILSKYGKLEEAIMVLNKAYEQTLVDLEKALDLQHIDRFDHGEGEAYYNSQIVIIKGWHEAKVKEAKSYPFK